MMSLASLLPVFLVVCLMLPNLLHALEYSPPPIMLAKTLTNPISYEQYSVSEKFDGVRVYWNGRHLLTRSGRSIDAPKWFIDGLPDAVVDGELWLDRGQFDRLSGLIRSSRTDDVLWKKMKFMAFDLPSSVEPFTERNKQLETLTAEQNTPWFRAVKRHSFATKGELDDFLSEVVAKGGEGVMLNHVSAQYESARSDAILKLKPRFDDEAVVVAHREGNGKYDGLMGALVVEWRGRQFRLGTGFSLVERQQPPAIGSKVTFEYSGLTSTGLPRFARYLREFSAD